MKWTIYPLICVFSLLAPAAPLPAQDVPLNNPSFERQTEGKPTGWESDLWDKTEEEYFLRVEQGEAFDGEYYLVLENRKPNHTRVFLTVPVEGGNNYLFSARVKTEDVGTDTVGAHLGVDQFWGSSASMTGTIRDWMELRLNIKVAPEIETLRLALQLGGFSALNTGKACFDAVRLRKIARPEAGVPEMLAALPEETREETAAEPAAPAPRSSTWVIVLIIILALGLPLSLFAIRRKRRETQDS